MADKALDIAVAAAKASSQETYYKVQVRAWTRFDPSQSELIDIAAAVEGGTGFVSAIEVTRVAKGLNEIDDSDIREQFQNLAAAELVLRNMSALPTAVIVRLRDALTDDSKKQNSR